MRPDAEQGRRLDVQPPMLSSLPRRGCPSQQPTQRNRRAAGNPEEWASGRQHVASLRREGDVRERVEVQDTSGKSASWREEGRGRGGGGGRGEVGGWRLRVERSVTGTDWTGTGAVLGAWHDAAKRAAVTYAVQSGACGVHRHAREARHGGK